ncbi:MAG: type transport system permease protein, partial [Solirubrobacteraceae bacterium]|nr:type transport system permease protein [Solirubrobacteraceae bacterium]
RHEFGNPGGIAPHDAIWPIAHPIAYTLLWAAAIVAVCAPLSVALYQRSIRT